jgi:hypothetical protein
MKCSPALRPPRALRRTTTFARTSATSCLISLGVGSSSRRALQFSSMRFQYEPYARRVPLLGTRTWDSCRTRSSTTLGADSTSHGSPSPKRGIRAMPVSQMRRASHAVGSGGDLHQQVDPVGGRRRSRPVPRTARSCRPWCGPRPRTPCRTCSGTGRRPTGTRTRGRRRRRAGRSRGRRRPPVPGPAARSGTERERRGVVDVVLGHVGAEGDAVDDGGAEPGLMKVWSSRRSSRWRRSRGRLSPFASANSPVSSRQVQA